MKATVLPYIAPRKPRRQEPLRFVVRWAVDDTVYFQWFKRDNAACDFAQRLEDAGLHPRVLMK